ncbi:MAG: DUF3488 and transglutaminase-like domain-containing protein [Cellvibrionaceae bacterium]|nr:DUF3488 and transglutaminase-like domain-containing protein [Cellvibrionaceae bacterium]
MDADSRHCVARPPQLPVLLLVSVSAVSLHLGRLSPVLLLLMAWVLLWRLQIYRGQWAFPRRLWRLALVVSSLAVIVFDYRQWYALEPMVSLLLIAFLLKVLELQSTRDAMVLIFVGFFVTASALLFAQGLLMSLAASVVLCLLIACLLHVNAHLTPFYSKRTLYWLVRLVVQALPMMALLLLLFPRIGALWSVPLQHAQAYTGVSDSMSPGDFSQLSRSRQLAFRVSFDERALPANHQRYWRGLVLTHFDGRRWSRGQTSRQDDADLVHSHLGEGDQRALFRYEIVLEATAQAWLYAMPLAQVHTLPVQHSSNNELWLPEPVSQRTAYQVTSFVDYRTTASAQVLREALVLPQAYNPKTLALAQQWRRESSSVAAYIERVLAFYHQSFHYTLAPPLLGRHTVDEFLFDSRRGFCEHFSSSFVTLMRAAGIPARVVIGYQGGEWNAADEYLIVRQSDAHAWAEVWSPPTGWIRVDPTAAVAPDRVTLGLADSLSVQDKALLRRSALDVFKWSERLALRWDSLNYRWQRWVLHYDQQQQVFLWERLVDKLSSLRLALLLLVSGALVLIVCVGLGFVISFKAKTKSKEYQLYKQLCKRLADHGIVSPPGETPGQLCRRASGLLTAKHHELDAIAALLNTLFYGGQMAYRDHSCRRLRGLIKRL